jgi:hypothetical protein
MSHTDAFQQVLWFPVNVPPFYTAKQCTSTAIQKQDDDPGGMNDHQITTSPRPRNQPRIWDAANGHVKPLKIPLIKVHSMDHAYPHKLQLQNRGVICA